ncbi:hypothetical protein GQ44DRAFT_756640 [Phaeosphaeriaceae sp. PMI808]|nr:hypothetical protein GQ44DRAFT_756640 [Phaeosphaeriaceae sp. PMI808]
MNFVTSPLCVDGIEVPLISLEVVSPVNYHPEQRLYANAEGKLDLSRSQDRIARSIQKRLYFGLLSALSNSTFNLHNFSATGKRWPIVVDSDKVAAEILMQHDTLHNLCKRERKPMFQRHTQLLIQVSSVVEWLENQCAEHCNSLMELILLSVKILIQTIVHSYDDIAGWEPGRYHDPTVAVWYGTIQKRGERLGAASRALQSRMVENGWCIHQIHKVLSQFDYKTSYFFATLPRLKRGNICHDQCTEKSCQGWNSLPGATQARHQDVNCTCSTVSVSSVEVAKMIKKGHIPLVSVKEDEIQGLVLELHVMKRSSKFVAISHVWADGLGNAFENGLPECQLRSLMVSLEQVSKVQSKRLTVSSISIPLFWMDTFCIPVQPPGDSFPQEQLGQIKKEAIEKMNIIYSSCAYTLVLDAELRDISVSVDPSTKTAYIQFCGWTTRAWTLQEGCLPNLTVFALSDNIYMHPNDGYRSEMIRLLSVFRHLNIFSLLHKPSGSPDPSDSNEQCNDANLGPLGLSVCKQIWNVYSAQYFSIWDNPNSRLVLRKPPAEIANKYAQIWNELLDRTTSQPTDLPAIFANLLGVSAYEVLQMESEEARMALMIRQQRFLPVTMLYNTGPRLHRRLSTPKPPRTRKLQSRSVSNGDIEAAEPSPCLGRFQNRWVPATIGGDRMEKTMQWYGDYLEVKKQYLHWKGGKSSLLLTTNEKQELGTYFLLKLEEIGTFLVESIGDPELRSLPGVPAEVIKGHCFLIDHRSFADMLRPSDTPVQGAHLVILDASKDCLNLTTRYCDPIRISRTKKDIPVRPPGALPPGTHVLPTIKGETSEGSVNIVYGEISPSERAYLIRYLGCV